MTRNKKSAANPTDKGRGTKIKDFEDKKISDKVKKLDQYRQSMPAQLDMFQLLLPDEQRFSNTIELYDFIPKYVWGKVERVNGKFLDSLEREFECRGRHYKVEIKPASIRNKKGEERYYYPSKREELVEDALRKFASEGQGLFLDDQASVTFSLYQLQQELKSNGHSYSKDQIKDALMICAQTNIVVTSEDGSTMLVSSLFDTLGLQTREDWQGQGQKTRAFVRFNSLVTTSIKNKSFRLFNYKVSMAYKSVIARQLHKRMAHHFTQASLANPYTIMLTTIIRDFGLTAYDRLSHNLRDIQRALDEMKGREVILSYELQRTIDAENRSRLIDAKIIITPHPKFTSEVLHANRKQKTISISSTGNANRSDVK